MKQIADNIFVFEYELKIMPGVTFPVRSVFIELQSKELLIVSPGPFVPTEIKEFVEKYNNVYCLAPNSFHHLHLESFNGLFPEIEIFGPPSIKKKQPALSSKIKEVKELENQLSGQLKFFAIDGNDLLSETVVYDKLSKSLIVTDLLFNMRNPMPLGRKMLLKLAGAYDQPAQSRLIKASTKDKNLYLKSIYKLKELKCNLLVFSHGDNINDPKEIEKTLNSLGK